MRPSRLSAIGLAVILTILCLTNAQARAGHVTLSFQRIEPSNAPNNVAAQFVVDVYDQAMAASVHGIAIGEHDVLFTFRNNVGDASSISEIYFDNRGAAPLIPPPTVHNSIGGYTEFQGGGAKPGDLPGGENLSKPFLATASLSADAQGNPDRGVDTSDDIVGIQFATDQNVGFEGVHEALFNGDLRVGFHVRAIGNESDSFVNSPAPEPAEIPVPLSAPEPASVVLLLLGGLGLVGFRRRGMGRAWARAAA